MSKKYKKYLIPSMLFAGVLTIGILGATVALAQESLQHTPIIERLAERFNLNEEDVQEVFNEVHEERQAEMHARFEERLSDAVAEGKITEEQKALIETKHEEIEGRMSNLRNLSPEERRSEMQNMHNELRDWAEENGVALGQFGFFNGGFRKGFHAGYRLGLRE